MPPKKKLAPAQPVQRNVRTRGMGASPGGLRSLDSIPPPPPAPISIQTTRHTRSTSQETQGPPPLAHGTRRTRRDPSLKPKVKADAGNADVKTTTSTTQAQATSSDNAVAPTLQQPSSRSQSPHLETESDSFPQIPESRSTTPPARHNTRSQTRSMSPSAAEQQHKQKQPTTKRAPAIRSGNAKSGNVSSGISKNKKRSRKDFTDSLEEDLATFKDTANREDEEPSAKRSRREEPSSTLNDQPTPTFMAPLATIAEDSSADDASPAVERPPRPSRIRSRSASRQRLTSADVNAGDASAEESSSDNRQQEELRSPLIKLSGKPLTPKPTSSSSESNLQNPISDLLEERNEIYRAVYGRDMPVPQYQKGIPRYARIHYRGEDNNGFEDEDEMSFLGESPSGSRGRHKSALIPLTGTGPGSLSDQVIKAKKQAKERSEAEKAQNNKGAIHHFFKFHEVAIPAGSSSGTMILTSRKLIEATLSLANHAEAYPDSVPTAAEMKQILIELRDRKSAQSVSLATSSQSKEQTTGTHPEASTSQYEHQTIHDLESSQHRRRRVYFESEHKNVTMSNVEDVEGAALQEGLSEVHTEAAEPQTPTPQQPNAQQSRGWFTGVTSFLASPMKLLGRRNQTAQAATTNGDAVVGTSSNEHLIPQTSDFAIPPTTPSNTRNRRKIAPNTERRPRVLIQQPQPGSMTDRRIRNRDPATLPPLHARGVLTPEQKQEIWRQQDEEAALNRKKRREPVRAKTQARVEDEAEQDANLHVESARTGEKRKNRHPDSQPKNEHDLNIPVQSESAPARKKRKVPVPGIAEEDFNWSGHFCAGCDACAPDSSEEGDTIDDCADGQPCDFTADGQPRGLVADGQPRNLIADGQPCPYIPTFPIYGGNGYGTSTRNDKYNGTLFAQPPLVQANIDKGIYPLTPRRQKTALESAIKAFGPDAEKYMVDPRHPSNIFTASTPTPNVLDTEQPVQQVVNETPEVAAAEEATYTPTPPRTFTADYEDDESEESEVEGGNERGKELEAQDGQKTSGTNSSVLQEKTWTQTPPAKPRPSNAQLPQISAQSTAAEVAKARYDKFKPTRPSGLRHVTQMSPLPVEPAAAVAQHSLNMDYRQDYSWDPDVLKVLEAIPDDRMIETQLPSFLYEERVHFDPDVENAVRGLIG